MLPSFFKVSLKRFLILLAAYEFTRLLFLLWNWSLYAQDTWGDILWSFFLGLRFDISAIALTNAVLFLLWMAPSRVLATWPVRWFDWTAFYIINFICLGLNFVDLEFVKFIGKRTSYDLLFIGDDIQQQAGSILTTYWYFLLTLILFNGFVVWLCPGFPRRGVRERWWVGALWRIGVAFAIFTGARGGYGFKPVNPMQAYFNTKHEMGLLTLNTPFNLIKSRPNGTIEKEHYFARNEDAILRLKKMTELSRPPLGVAKNWNVVVLILESFGSEFTGVANNYPGYTPFLDELARKSYYYKFDFANARRSIEGVPAAICGLPSMMDEPILTSDFSSDRLDCLPKILSQHGYSTYFLHGAHNGSMHFDSFSHVAGFENFVGLNEYPKGHDEDFDQVWGVLDEPMLQYAAGVIDRAPKPVMLGLFTLSSHHPYYIPPKYKDRFPKGTLEIHESLGYTDLALREFFKTAETKPWFKNTIFVLTADHTQKSEHKEYQDLIGPHRVPLIFYIPGLEADKVPYDPKRITQQIDIMPSVLDLLGIQVPDRLLLGQSIFDLKKPGRSYNYSFYGYWYLDPQILLDFGKPPHPLKAYTHEGTFNIQDADPNDKKFAEPLLNLKAAVQYLDQGLVHNNLYDWRKTLGQSGSAAPADLRK